MKISEALALLLARCVGNEDAEQAYSVIAGEIERLKARIDDLANLSWDGIWPKDIDKVMSGEHAEFLRDDGTPLVEDKFR